MKKIKILLFAALVAGFFGTSCKKEYDIDYDRWYKDASEEDGRRQISVMSFNVRFGSSADDTGTRDWSVRKTAVAAMLKAIQPVLMGCQECEPEQRKDIISSHPEYSVIGVDLHGPNEEVEQVAIFYLKDSVQVLEHGTFYLTDTPDTPSRLPQSNHYRASTWGHFKMVNGGQEFFYFNTHLDTHTEAHKAEVDAILGKIKQYNTEGLPIYLTGDLNTDESSTAFNSLWSYGFKNARVDAIVGDSYKTYNGYGDYNGAIYDHCFYKGFYSVQKFNTIRDKFAGVPYISDHYPISITLKFN